MDLLAKRLRSHAEARERPEALLIQCIPCLNIPRNGHVSLDLQSTLLLQVCSPLLDICFI